MFYVLLHYYELFQMIFAPSIQHILLRKILPRALNRLSYRNIFIDKNTSNFYKSASKSKFLVRFPCTSLVECNKPIFIHGTFQFCLIKFSISVYLQYSINFNIPSSWRNFESIAFIGACLLHRNKLESFGLDSDVAAGVFLVTGSSNWLYTRSLILNVPCVSKPLLRVLGQDIALQS